MKKMVFLSDAHVDGRDDTALRDLMSFLRGLKGKISALFIGGDLFDFWIGDNSACVREYGPFLELLKGLRDTGTEILYVEGNHDFFLKSYFSDVLGARVFPRECTEVIDGHRVYIAHGDIADNGYGYRFFKFLVHNRLILFLSGVLPPMFVWRIARAFSRRSRKNRKEEHPSLASALRRFAEEKFTEGYDVVVLGHLHHAGIAGMKRNGRKHLYVTLGDWMFHSSYLEYDKGTFTLKTWKPKRG